MLFSRLEPNSWGCILSTFESDCVFYDALQPGWNRIHGDASQKALEFILDLKKNRINGFQRNYSKTMEEHSTHFTDNVSFTIDLFEKVVYLDILQFKNPSKLWRFLKVISV